MNDPHQDRVHHDDGTHIGSPRRPALVRSVVRAGHDGDVGAVRSALDDDDPTVRAVAVGASIRLAANGSGTLGDATEALLRGLGDDAVSVRRRSATATATWATLIDATDPADVPVDRVVDALIVLLGDDDDRVVDVAAFACGEIPLQEFAALRERVVAALIVTTAHTDHLCRESAVAALGSIGDPSGLPAVLAACHDRANVRRRGVLALAAFDDPSATSELRRLVDDRDLQVSQAAAELLAIESGEPT